MAFIPVNYKQTDKRWATKKLGSPLYTMASDGCVTTVAARWASWVLKDDVTPGELCDWLNAHKGYTSGGLLIWAKLEEFTNKKLKYLGKSIIVRPFATYIGRWVIWGRIYHFVGVMAKGMCFDPWDGKIKSIAQPYWRLTNDYRYLRNVTK